MKCRRQGVDISVENPNTCSWADTSAVGVHKADTPRIACVARLEAQAAAQPRMMRQANPVCAALTETATYNFVGRCAKSGMSTCGGGDASPLKTGCRATTENVAKFTSLQFRHKSAESTGYSRNRNSYRSVVQDYDATLSSTSPSCARRSRSGSDTHRTRRSGVWTETPGM